MSDSSSAGVTRLLMLARQGDKAAILEVAVRVNDHLHQIATRFFAGEPTGHTLQATAIVNEVWLSLIRANGQLDVPELVNRGTFYAFVATAMRNMLVDYARNRRALKRGGDRMKLSVDDRDGATASQAVDVLALHEALQNLELQRKRAAEVVHLRFFAGCTIEETAAALDVSPETVKLDWRFAKAWLKRELGKND